VKLSDLFTKLKPVLQICWDLLKQKSARKIAMAKNDGENYFLDDSCNV